MKKGRLFLLIFSLLMMRGVLAFDSGEDVAYKVTYVKDSLPHIRVNFSWKSDENGWLRLKLENNSWGDNDIYDCIGDFEVHPVPEQIRFDRDSSLILIKTRPNVKHSIHYSLVQDFEEPLKNHHRYRPIVNDNYFHLLGMRLFIVPTDVFPEDDSRARLRISWDALPGDGLLHSSFGPERDLQIEVTREELYASFFVGGDFRRYTFNFQDKPVYFLTRGLWESITDEQVLHILKETIGSQYVFWKDSLATRYSVSLIPTTEQNTYSIGGSGLTDSFISFASNNPETTLQRITWLYNHELLHKWMGRTIRNQNEVQQYWFSEGFTDYYAYKLMMKNGRLGAADFIRMVNEEILEPHYSDKHGISTTPNAELTFQTYWSQYGVYAKLPYRRGFLYAFLLDNQIREQSDYEQSLDNLMHDLLRLSQTDPEFRISTTTFLQALSKYRIEKGQDHYERYIRQGELIDFDGYLPEGLLFKKEEDSVFFVMDELDGAEIEEKLKR